ncbi:MAG TPA: helix-turn-helix domain-containing protein [Candidatus Udaeobacter sp.]|nr:helix-turn-helix domain-containing protein [Candidatus Udaeobacter sp.]
MTIEGLGKKFQEARLARNLTLDEAARMTKIRPQRLAEIEADDFSQFPSLAYAKGFLLIYGKFLDVDVTPYLDAFEDSESVTVDGYSYLQENERAKPVSAPVARRRPVAASGGSNRVSPMPLIVGIVVLVLGFLAMKFFLNVQRLVPAKGASSAQASPTVTPAVASSGPSPAVAQNVGAAATSAPVASPAATQGPAETRKALAANSTAGGEPEVRKAKPVTKEELAQAHEGTTSPAPESADQNRVAIQPLKRTYVRVTVGDEGKAAFERWVSPSDGPVEFRGKHVAIRVLDPEAVKITKNGQELQQNDQDVTVN